MIQLCSSWHDVKLPMMFLLDRQDNFCLCIHWGAVIESLNRCNSGAAVNIIFVLSDLTGVQQMC